MDEASVLYSRCQYDVYYRHLFDLYIKPSYTSGRNQLFNERQKPIVRRIHIIYSILECSFLWKIFLCLSSAVLLSVVVYYVHFMLYMNSYCLFSSRAYEVFHSGDETDFQPTSFRTDDERKVLSSVCGHYQLIFAHPNPYLRPWLPSV